ncbi:hypothetical protein [Geodermatophilus sp. DSM 44513]|uniref:hypothetical protein n=1 Tax=Geodermatophilus sp. DSM 44513 TaxID=1528104 RepID=UPI00141286BA|nr:hypothetical protein [Geodermatophilus sp. DSM 44513]WNV77040.1 hypothetical protein RTG05_07145 [Geodermatophilus sp. DSM 44513]
MVTRVPPPERPAAEPPLEVLGMRAQHLDEWSESLEAAASRVLHELDAAASRVLRELEEAASRLLRELEAAASRRFREQADRLMAALSTTGLVLSAGDANRLVVPLIKAAQPAALAYGAPRAGAAHEVVMPALGSARATLSAAVDRTSRELDARRAEVAASATTSSHNAGKADALESRASGDASVPPRPLRGDGRDRPDRQGEKRTRKKAGPKHRLQPSRAKRPLSADEVIRPAASRPGDRPADSPGILGEHGPEALCEAA